MCIYHNLFPTRSSTTFCPDITPLELLSSLFQSHELHLIRKQCTIRERTRGFEYTDVLCPRTTVKHNIRGSDNQALEDEFECEQCQAVIESGGWKGRTFDEILKANNDFQPLSVTSVAAALSLTDSDMEESVYGDGRGVEYEDDDEISFKTEPSSVAEESVPGDRHTPKDDPQMLLDEDSDKAASPQSLIRTDVMTGNAVLSRIKDVSSSVRRSETATDNTNATMRKRSIGSQDDINEQQPKRQNRREASPEEAKRPTRFSHRLINARSPAHRPGVFPRSAKAKSVKAPERRRRGYSSGSALIEISSDSDAETYDNTDNESEADLASPSVKVTSARQAQGVSSSVKAQHGNLSPMNELHVEPPADKSYMAAANAHVASRDARRKLAKDFNDANAGVESDEVTRMAVKDGSFSRALEAMMDVESQASRTDVSNTHRLREINAEITDQLAAALEDNAQGKTREASLATQLATERRKILESGLNKDAGLSVADQETSSRELTELRQKVTDLTETLGHATNVKSAADTRAKNLEATIRELKDRLALRDTSNETTTHEGPIVNSTREENQRLLTQIKNPENDIALAQARAATTVNQAANLHNLQQQNISLKKDLMRLEAEKNDAVTRDTNSAQGNAVLKAKIARLEGLLRPVQTQPNRQPQQPSGPRRDWGRSSDAVRRR